MYAKYRSQLQLPRVMLVTSDSPPASWLVLIAHTRIGGSAQTKNQQQLLLLLWDEPNGSNSEKVQKEIFSKAPFLDLQSTHRHGLAQHKQATYQL